MSALRVQGEVPGIGLLAIVGWTAVAGWATVGWPGPRAFAADGSFVAAATHAQRLELPQPIDLETPAVGQPLTHPQIPSGFFGCWSGTPREFDTVLPAAETDSLYRLHHVTKCYAPSKIETREFILMLKPRHPRLDAVLGFLSLGHHEAVVGWEQTGIYAIAPNQVYSRGALRLELTERSLFRFPRSTPCTLVDEEVATLVDSDNLTIDGRAFLTGDQPRSVGTWHADFHR